MTNPKDKEENDPPDGNPPSRQGNNQYQLRLPRAVDRDEPGDPYPGGPELRPYPPTGALEVQPGPPGDNTEAAFDDRGSGGTWVRCSWDADSFTVTWKVVNPRPGTFAEIGLGAVDDRETAGWFPLGIPSEDEKARIIPLTDLAFDPNTRRWWWMASVHKGSVADVDP